MTLCKRCEVYPARKHGLCTFCTDSASLNTMKLGNTKPPMNRKKILTIQPDKYTKLKPNKFSEN